jgi:zinc-binding alcohol dehydrogenase/oxidoreductase
MRALQLTAAGGIEAATLTEVAELGMAAGQVRVRMAAAALNHRELWIAQGMYPGMQLPATLGCDGAGVIEAVGDGVNPSRIGEQVILYPGLEWGDDPALPRADFGLLGMPGPGTIAERIVVENDHALVQPAHLDSVQAAALPLGGLTAWRALMVKGGLRAGETVLVTGIGGGVATFALLFAVAMGARVFVTSGSDKSIERAVGLGATGGVNYRSERWGKALGAQTKGIDLVFDGAPAGGYAEYGRALAMGARVVIYGSTGGGSFPVNAPELFLKNVSVHGTNVGSPQDFAAMVAFVAEHRIMPVIDQTFAFDETSEALAYLKDAHAFGKVVIAMDAK